MRWRAERHASAPPIVAPCTFSSVLRIHNVHIQFHSLVLPFSINVLCVSCPNALLMFYLVGHGLQDEPPEETPHLPDSAEVLPTPRPPGLSDDVRSFSEEHRIRAYEVSLVTNILARLDTF